MLPHVKRKEVDVLFNDALSTFYLRLYGIGHMVSSEKGKLVHSGQKEPSYHLFRVELLCDV